MTDAAPRTESELLREIGTLPWLAPSAGSLAALCRSSTASWSNLRDDPGLVLLLVRSSPGVAPNQFPTVAIEALSPLEFASRLLAGSARGVIDWTDPVIHSLLTRCRMLAHITRGIVAKSGRGNPEMGWTAGLLAPLGWLAASVIAPYQVRSALDDPALIPHPAETQRRHLGVEVASLTRRLTRAWALPEWLSGVIGRLDLPLYHACKLGSDPILFAAVRLAIESVRRAGLEPGIELGGDLAAEVRLLGAVPDCPAVERVEATGGDPYREPLLRDLVTVALESGRVRRASLVTRLERDADALHTALRDQVQAEESRVRDAKLRALAEFAAGAGHEINNPLAVISGQAQYLLRHEEWYDEEAQIPIRMALENVISQTRRIHSILRELMQFARPTPPRPSAIDLPTLFAEVESSVSELAEQKQVRIEVIAPDHLTVHVDGEQVRQALSCLLRNAIEAASGGWARLSVRVNERIEVWVEDSGPGPADEQRPHLFDPFYSGRNAGRGKGLGLPVAWRLARQNGGDVYLDLTRSGEPTRFVLTLPLTVTHREAA